MKAILKGAALVGVGALVLGSSLAMSTRSPAAATQIKPQSKTFIKCNKTAPCFEGENLNYGDGVLGIVEGTNPSSTLPGAGGVYGVAGGEFDSGVVGLGYASYTAGVFGLAGNGYGGFFENSAGDIPSLLVENNTAGGEGIEAYMAGGSFVLDADGDGVFSGFVEASNYLTAIKTRGGDRLGAFAARSTRETLEDTGTARLAAGESAVRFDPAFESAIDASRGYQVFLTPDGETRGLYVSAKYEGGFMVREIERGHSSLLFDYRVVAHPNGASDTRLPRLNWRVPQRPNISTPQLPQL